MEIIENNRFGGERALYAKNGVNAKVYAGGKILWSNILQFRR